MMATGVSIHIDDAEVVKAINALAGENLLPAMESIGGFLVRSTQRRFEKEVDPDGKPWARLKPRTAARRIGSRVRGYQNILRVSGRLSQSIAYETGADNVRVGTNVAYAAVQQLGAEIDMPDRRQTIYQRYDAAKDELDQRFVKKKASTFARDVDVKAHTIRVPARPYLGVDEQDRTEILKILGDFYGDKAGGTP